MMFFKKARLTRRLFVCLVVVWTAGLGAAESDWQNVERVVAVGDVHGDYDNYIDVLRQAGLIDRRGRWSGGTTHFVQLGDVPDRGPDTDKIIRHLMDLEKQAKKAGGMVHPLIGNHEVMNMLGDLRYVHPGEYKALKTRSSKRLRKDYLEQVVDYVEAQQGAEAIDEGFRERWLEEHPLGIVEHRQHWHPEGEFGAWVASHNPVIRINRSLFVHGGISSDYLDRSLDDVNDAVRAALLSQESADLSIVDDERGPLWYRGLAMGEETPEIAAEVDTLLAHFDVDRIVMGHTPGFGTVVPRYDGKVLAADVGISDYYGGHLASVLLIEGEAFTIQRGERVPLPSSPSGLLDYYRAVNALEPGVNNLEVRLQRLEASNEAP